jgi:hypothetical protein
VPRYLQTIHVDDFAGKTHDACLPPETRRSVVGATDKPSSGLPSKSEIPLRCFAVAPFRSVQPAGSSPTKESSTSTVPGQGSSAENEVGQNSPTTTAQRAAVIGFLTIRSPRTHFHRCSRRVDVASTELFEPELHLVRATDPAPGFLPCSDPCRLPHVCQYLPLTKVAIAVPGFVGSTTPAANFEIFAPSRQAGVCGANRACFINSTHSVYPLSFVNARPTYVAGAFKTLGISRSLSV